MIKFGMMVFIIGSCQCVSMSLVSEYANTKQLPFVDQSMALTAFVHVFGLPLGVGVEYFKIRSVGTLHDPNHGNMVTSRHQFGIPVSIGVAFTPLKRFRIQADMGVKFFLNQPLASSQTTAIEGELSRVGSPIIADYSEQGLSSMFYKLTLSHKIWKGWQIIFSKTWGSFINSSSFLYLNTYNVKKRSVYKYDPISVGVSHTF